ncbi:MAG: PQQ-binding-like beta-propeller repeat protein [Phycisphaerales bacterium]
MGIRVTRAIYLMVLLAAVLGRQAIAQQDNPVYPDDSATARQTLLRVGELVGGGNSPEAVRELQRLLDEQPDRVVASEADGAVFVSVRARVHAMLLNSAELLELYRKVEGARGQRELDAGRHSDVERARLLTSAGLEATLRVAQEWLEAGCFDAASRTLDQLERHPDRRGGGDGPRRTVEFAARLAPYLARPVGWDRVRRWQAEAGSGQPVTESIAPLPPLLRTPSVDSTIGNEALDAEGVPATPLWSLPMEPVALPDESSANHPEAAPTPEDLAANLWVFPTVVGDTLVVNDGVFITARDRYTLQPRWWVRPASPEATDDPLRPRRAAATRSSGRLVEDTNTTTVHGRTVVATTGIASTGEREGESVTCAIDLVTGRLLWAVDLPNSDPRLEGTSIRGPALIDGQTVVVCARKNPQGRRIISISLVGLSIADGSVRWVRPLGSAGAIPWGRGERRVGDAPLLHEGVVYCVDSLGIAAAVEAATGRPVWIKALPIPAMSNAGGMEVGMPWQWGKPIIEGPDVIFIAPNRRAVVRLDRATGAMVAIRSTTDLGDPQYLLKAGDRLAAVGRNAIAFVELTNLATGQISTTRTFPNGIVARVVVAGDRLVVPRFDGLALIDPKEPGRDAGNVRIQRFGNVLALASQLLVIDATNLHSFLTWGVANRLLNDRMVAEPDDPEPAITFAELAYRSSNHDQIAGAADRALQAIDRPGAGEAHRLSRQRLFRVLSEMVVSTQERWVGGEGAFPAPRRAASGQADQPPMIEARHLGEVIVRLGRAAQTPDERVSHLIAMGQFKQTSGDAAAAVEAFQQVLADANLSAGAWRAGGMAVRAELEATRRLQRLISESGPTPYAGFDAQAQATLAALAATAPATEFERIARQFPVSSVAPGAWIRAAEAHEAAGRSHAALAALRAGLACAEAMPSHASAVGELAGRLVTRLRANEQYFAAAQIMSRMAREHRAVVLTDGGLPLDAGAVSADLMKRLAGLSRLPRISAEVRPDAQSIAGWSLLSARSRETHGRACEQVMMVSGAESKIGLWGIGSGGAAQAAGGEHLHLLWSRAFTGVPPTILRLDPDSVYMVWDDPADAGPSVERVDAIDGRSRWKTEPLRTLLLDDRAAKARLDGSPRYFEVPIDGQVRATDVLIALDDQAVAVVERCGRAAGFDAETGRVIWKAVSPITQVSDIDAASGVVVIAGAAAPADDAAAVVGLTPTIVVLDARTGAPLHRLDALAGTVRWIRLWSSADAPGATLIAGLGPQIDAFDLASGRLNWSIPGGPGFSSLDAWLFGERLFVLDEHRSLWLASAATGRVGASPLETYEHLLGAAIIEACAIGAGRTSTVFATQHGVCVFDAAGELVGIDALDAQADDGWLLPAAVAEGVLVTVETRPVENLDGDAVYRLHILDSRSALLKATRELTGLDLPPRAIAVVDGRIIVTAGAHSYVLPAPEADAGRR